MPAKYRKRHITGTRVPIGRINNSQMKRDIYIRHFPVCYSSGETAVNHLVYKLEIISFPLLYTRKQYTSKHQYTKQTISFLEYK